LKLSISNLEQLSGVPVHTIRMWERRYKALEPLRSTGNTRYYTDNHLKRLLNIVGLNQAGLKISQACALSENEIDRYLEKDLNVIISSHANFEYYISQLLKHGLTYNETKFHELLNLCITDYGVTKAYEEVMFPLLQRLGLMWRRDHICPAQEHFISNIIRQKLMVAVDNIPLATQQKATWLLFLPEDEAHDIPLLFASYLLRSNGFKIIYLGGNVPFESIRDAYNINNIDNMLFFMVRQRPIKEANAYLTLLTEEFKSCAFYLAGNGNLIENLSLKPSITWFQTIAAFKQLMHTNA
jgi:DNA-binding transcriptional MerR regulator